MGQQITTIRNRFDGGIANDKRIKSDRHFALMKHFDLSYQRKLVPNYKKMVVGSLSTDELNLNNMTSDAYVGFVYTNVSSSENRLFGLAIGANSRPVIKTYDVDGGDFTVDWQATTNGTADDTDARLGNATRGNDTFWYYRNYLYTWTTDALIAYKTDDSEAVIDNKYEPGEAILSVVNGVVHSKDDNCYFFHNRNVHKINNTTVTANAFTGLPTDCRITAACEYGDYLAIAVVNNTKVYDRSPNVKCTVYLWSRDTSLTVADEKIDFGTGEIVHLEVLDGKLTVKDN